MTMDDFLVQVFCVVDDELQGIPLGRLRPGGPQPFLADSEVIIMAVVGELAAMEMDTAIYPCFRRSHRRECAGLTAVRCTSGGGLF